MYTEEDLIDFHNFVFRHENKFLPMGEYVKEFKAQSNKQVIDFETALKAARQNSGHFSTQYHITKYLFQAGIDYQKSQSNREVIGDEEIEKWYRQWMNDNNKHGIATINVLDMLKDFAKESNLAAVPVT